ncbi:hypothetical protein NicSoilB4_31550 [Arthrobacter sp. NicSoilB4]|uniref:hypothetical protein n=1 Tax=Arthrobacter sp. NicSoilB4 TaxID=2830997 RepID=UPI001CC6D93F|nr:hypothetical protein [Arthrobacter sp. NicSoilB4]BCW68392.1 hypothetical protein NicSoilB4_31550 [Arthrobacter sp. NicSoilB4]
MVAQLARHHNEDLPAFTPAPTRIRRAGPVLSRPSGFIPLIAAATAAAFGWSEVSLVYIACGAIGLIAALATRETWGPRQRQEVDQLVAAGK